MTTRGLGILRGLMSIFTEAKDSGRLPNLMLWVSFIFVMITSWSHVKWTFQQFEFASDSLVAGLSATSVEIGYATVTYAITMRKQSGERTAWLWVFTLFLTFVSVFANFLHNATVSYGMEAVFTPEMKLAGSLLLSLTFPVTSLIMADIVSNGSISDRGGEEDIFGEITRHAIKFIKGEYKTIEEACKEAGVSANKMNRHINALKG